MADMITRCPQCATAFRITPAHLKSARGSVRCGSCLHVFDARKHLVVASTQSSVDSIEDAADTPQRTEPAVDQPAPTEAPSPLTEASEPPAEPPVPPEEDTDDILISDDMDVDSDELSPEFRSAFADDDVDDRDFPSSASPTQTSLFERDASQSPTDEDPFDEDESWALKLLDEDDTEAPAIEERAPTDRAKAEVEATKKYQYSPTATDDADLYAPTDGEVDLPTDGERSVEPADDSSSDQWQITETVSATELIAPEADESSGYGSTGAGADTDTGATPDNLFSEVDEHAEAFSAPPLRADHVGLDYLSQSKPNPSDFGQGDLDQSDHVRSERDRSNQAPDNQGKSYQGANNQGRNYLDAIEPEPVEFSVRRERNFWRSRLLWGLLSLLALLLLLAQVAWLQYPTLSRLEPYRSVYAWACGWLDCELPELRDTDAIRTSNLVVRSHPRLDNALMVDVILQNTADFAQPFPILEVTFSDLQSQVVAQRRFQPHEYLGGELAGQNVMPVRQPVHIALEIIDPGPEAVNYRIAVVEGD